MTGRTLAGYGKVGFKISVIGSYLFWATTNFNDLFLALLNNLAPTSVPFVLICMHVVIH